MAPPPASIKRVVRQDPTSKEQGSWPYLLSDLPAYCVVLLVNRRPEGSSRIDVSQAQPHNVGSPYHTRTLLPCVRGEIAPMLWRSTAAFAPHSAPCARVRMSCICHTSPRFLRALKSAMDSQTLLVYASNLVISFHLWRSNATESLQI